MFAVVSVSLLNNDRLDFPSTCRLFVGLPGRITFDHVRSFRGHVKSSCQNVSKTCHFQIDKKRLPEGSAGERSNIL